MHAKTDKLLRGSDEIFEIGDRNEILGLNRFNLWNMMDNDIIYLHKNTPMFACKVN